jgi:hypothetical protein
MGTWGSDAVGRRGIYTSEVVGQKGMGSEALN